MLAEVRREGHASCAGHVHEDALGLAVPVRASAGAGVAGRAPVVAALSAIVPVGTDGRAVIGVLTAASRGISRVLRT